MAKSAVFLIPATIALTACGALGGGPDSKTIEDLARKAMVANLGDQNPAAMATAAQSAKIAKRGMCNTQAEPGTHVCMVDVTVKLPGAAQETTQTFVVKAKKAADGKWVAAD